ncbi:transglycosylase family protein [Streptomyces sp. NPDC090442]|uniref:transglycosylase family protein n=1 Tax=Streptomyces sp. NPDC090442 TaxID=3365962 RepID=UPI00381D9443
MLALITVASATPSRSSGWDSLAACESGGRWHISSGNGYSGGLQFSPNTWRAYGGTRYAPAAAQASRAAQVKVAKRVVSDIGWSAWPHCSRLIGVAGHSPMARTAVVPRRLYRRHSPHRQAPPPSAIVKNGDTLSSMAQRYHVQGNWPILYAVNINTIGRDPNHLLPGWKLRLGR